MGYPDNETEISPIEEETSTEGWRRSRLRSLKIVAAGVIVLALGLALTFVLITPAQKKRCIVAWTLDSPCSIVKDVLMHQMMRISREQKCPSSTACLFRVTESTTDIKAVQGWQEEYSVTFSLRPSNLTCFVLAYSESKTANTTAHTKNSEVNPVTRTILDKNSTAVQDRNTSMNSKVDAPGFNFCCLEILISTSVLATQVLQEHMAVGYCHGLSRISCK